MRAIGERGLQYEQFLEALQIMANMYGPTRRCSPPRLTRPLRSKYPDGGDTNSGLHPPIRCNLLRVLRQHVFASEMARKERQHLQSRVVSVLAGAANVVRTWYLKRVYRRRAKELARLLLNQQLQERLRLCVWHACAPAPVLRLTRLCPSVRAFARAGRR